MAYIQQVDENDATGDLQRLYSSARRRAGRVANIIKLMSLDGRACQASIEFYIRLMKSPNALDAATREMMAAVVSNANGCFY